MWRRLLLPVLALLCALPSLGFLSSAPGALPSGSVPVGTTAPASPTVGQLWFDPVSVQLYIWYNDGTSTQWVPTINEPGASAGGAAPLINPAGGQNNYAPIDSPVFTGTVTLPAGSIADATLASAYSGVGACAAGSVVTTLNRNAAPTCTALSSLGSGLYAPLTNPAGGQNNYAPLGSPNFTGTVSIGGTPITSIFAPISSPTFTGTSAFTNITVSGTSSFTGNMTFPDGSYYDTNGHEVMKNLGVGMVANTAGSGGVTGSSIGVFGGWTFDVSSPAVNAFWDKYGPNQVYDVRSQYLDTGNPSKSVDGWATIHGDVQNAALGNPWAELDLYNQSAYAGGAMDTGYGQRWQAEGFQAINALGIHQQTWQGGCTGVIVTAGITGAGASLSDCAVAAIASTFYNNINYKMLLTNGSTGTLGQASFLLRNSIHTGGMYLQGTGFTPVAGFNAADQLVISTNAANGISIPNVVNDVIRLGVGQPADSTYPIAATVNRNGNSAVLLTNTSSGTSASVEFIASNGGPGIAMFGQMGTNGVSIGMPANSTFILNNSTAAGMEFVNSQVQPIDLWIGGTEIARVNTIGLTLQAQNGTVGGGQVGWGIGSTPDPTIINYQGTAGIYNLTAVSGSHYNTASGNWNADSATSFAIGMSTNVGIAFYRATGATIGANTPFATAATITASNFGLGHVSGDTNGSYPTTGTGQTLYNGSRDSLGAAQAGSGNVIDLYFGTPFSSGPTCIATFNGQPWVVYNSLRTTTHVQFACVVPNTMAACPTMDITYFCFAQT